MFCTKTSESVYELEMFTVRCKKVGSFRVVKGESRRDVNGACVCVRAVNTNKMGDTPVACQ